jgi:hypothetical protein
MLFLELQGGIVHKQTAEYRAAVRPMRSLDDAALAGTRHLLQ